MNNKPFNSEMSRCENTMFVTTNRHVIIEYE